MRGALAHQLGQNEEAVHLLTRALVLNSNHAVAQYNCGLALVALERPEEALRRFNHALALRPHYVKALNNRGVVLVKLKRSAEALASYDRALALDPGDAEILANRSVVLASLGRLEEAVQSASDALALAPGSGPAFYNRANALGEMHRSDEALADYARAIALQPDYAGAHLNQALCRLITGDYSAAAWEGYEWRWRTAQQNRQLRSFAQAQWLGEDITGKTILLHAEQGFGDSIQFCRYAPLLAARGARVVLEVQRPLMALMASLEGVSQLVAEGEALPAFDVHCPLLSLPRAFHTTLTTIPSQVPYLQPSPEALAHWRARLGGESAARRIGVVWAGNRHHGNDAARSIGLGAFVPLLTQRALWFSLQKDVRPGDDDLLKSMPGVQHLGEALKDFDDTAAVVSLMDAVITVDTSMAHLAGALGKDVRILLPRAGADWRWMLKRSDSPWYPTAHLYRQETVGAWDDVLAQVAHDLTL